MNKYILGICAGVILLVLSSTAGAASLQKAIMYNQHGLKDKAKSEFIDLIFSKSSRSDKAEAYYFLGTIAFDERKISVALDSWKTLVAKFPKSKQAKLVKGKISELAEVVGESKEKSIRNAVARSYLRHGDFWSEYENRTFEIIARKVSGIGAANKWYDKVITEFPGTPAAKLAYENKLRTLLGGIKEEAERIFKNYSEKRFLSRGSEEKAEKFLKNSSSKYLPQFKETFAAFERDFPKSGSLQAFRYQIAEMYETYGLTLKDKNGKNVKTWLNAIKSAAGEQDSFYKDLAKRKLRTLK